MSNRIAIVVLGCASRPYDQTVAAIRRTWGSQLEPGLDIYYLYGNPQDDRAYRVLSGYVGGNLPAVEDDAICRVQDVLIAGCADHIRQQQDCLLRKRLIAFDYLAATDRYDLIYTVCATSYVDQQQLVRYTDSLIPRRLVAGAISLDASSTAPFVSGASMILSIDIAQELASHRREIIEDNVFGFRDDVAIGHWIATRLSRIPLGTFVDDIKWQPTDDPRSHLRAVPSRDSGLRDGDGAEPPACPGRVPLPFPQPETAGYGSIPPALLRPSVERDLTCFSNERMAHPVS